MKKYTISLSLAIMALLVVALTQIASAHEHQIFKIGDKYYQFTVGSLNEPVVVDDKTGVDLRVELVTKEHAMEKHNESNGAHIEEKFPSVNGLEKTLKVELGAGGKTKTLDLSPAWNDPGAYRANFTPTLQTTYNYRFFGKINTIPVDLTFSCNPAGNPQTEADMAMVKISDKVERVSKVGAFGCPVAKADLGFPEQSVSLYDLNSNIQNLQNTVDQNRSSARSLGTVGIVLGLLGLAAGAGAWMRKKV